MIDKLNTHYSFTSPSTVHDEEALTVLELSGRQGAKINEIIDAQNKLAKDTETTVNQIKNELVPQTVQKEVQKNINDGTFTQAINEYTQDLEGRLDNLITLQEGSTTGDAELIDARTDHNGTTWQNVGKHIRNITGGLRNDLNPLLTENLVQLDVTFLGGWYSIPSLDSPGWHLDEFKHIKIDVQVGETYYVSCNYGWDMVGVVFFDKDSNYVNHALVNTASNIKESYTAPIIVPDGATYMIVQTMDKWELGARKVSGKRATYDETYMDNLVSSMGVDSPILEDAEGIYHDKSILIEGNLDTSTDDGYKTWIVMEYNVERGERYRINGTVAYDNQHYFIKDTHGNVLASESVTGVQTPIDFTFDVTIPPNGVKLFVAGNVNRPLPKARKIKGCTNSGISLSHLTWVCIGDSLTEVNTRTSKHYFDYVQDKTGIQVVNMGLSGSGFMAMKDTSQSFYHRALNIPSDADVVTIFGSGNDLGRISTLGTPTDTTDATICGCINKTIDNILSVNPTVQIGIVAPTPWEGNMPSDNSTMATYCESLKAIALRRGIPYLDLFHESGLRPNDETFRNLAYSKDDGSGVHPDETGHKMISGRFYTFIQSLVGTY